MTKIEQLDDLLDKLERSLKASQLWEVTQPDDQALASEFPFSMDTLAPSQWLQWIFIPGMTRCIVQNTLPDNLLITPYFEEIWQEEINKAELLLIIQSIDKVFA